MGEFKVLNVTDRYTIKQLIEQKDDIESNIESIYNLSTTQDVILGLNWYRIAQTISENLAKHYNRSLSDVVGIIAALSPGCQWEKNVVDAIDILKHGSTAIVSTYGSNKSKAVDIYTGSKPDDILGGSKVKAFYQNILFPHLDQHITIDRHATYAACDWHKVYNASKYNKDNKYTVLENAYFSIARNKRLLGLQVQAIVWLTYKKVYGDKKDGFYPHDAYLYAPLTEHENDPCYLSALEIVRTKQATS